MKKKRTEEDSGTTHVCGKFNCHKCKEQYEDNPHHCCMKPLNFEKLVEEDGKLKILVAFDIETASVSVNPGKPNSFRQDAVLLIAHVICDHCWDGATETKTHESCPICGKKEHIFIGSQCVANFNNLVLNNLSSVAEKHKGKVHVYAHNLAGFDGRFVLRDIINRKLSDVKIVMAGSKLLKIGLSNVRYTDSLSFFQQPLSSLPKSFNFKEKAKGFFPHKFTSEDNWDYRGAIPKEHFYQPSSMKPGQSKIFYDWHKSEHKRLTEAKEEWVFKDEILKYCRSDVDILLTAIQKFKKEFKNITGLDPTTRNFTLASVGLETYRALDLKKKQVGITPIADYGANRKNSVVATAWLDTVEKEENIVITREKRIGPHYVDGFCASTNTVYEFWGCHWHGCPCEYDDPHAEIHLQGPTSSSTTPHAEQLKIKSKVEYYQKMELNVVEIKGCDFEMQYAQDRNRGWAVRVRIKELFSLRRAKKHANIRTSFFGGRTNNIMFMEDCAGDDHIRYLDFTSLYPYVLKYMKYPVGHPKVINTDFNWNVTENDWYFGFVRCKVLPPEYLYLPVLPVRQDSKLIFPLCGTCATNGYDDSGFLTETGIKDQFCHHNDRERVIEGTWTTEELKVAVIEQGYRIMEFNEVLHFEETSSELFSGYINRWLKIKQESSGWPSWVVNSEDHQATERKYLADYLEHEDIALDPENISQNAGRRSIAKLMLNSFWGKLAQRPNLEQVKLCYNYADLMALITDETIVMKRLCYYKLQKEERRRLRSRQYFSCYRIVCDCIWSSQT